MIYTYDEHGGYYDHVPPPGGDPARLDPARTRKPATYRAATTSTARACPAIVASPYSKPNARHRDVVHDHTSVLATIEAKWNLPALTYRDANAATVADFLDLEQAAFLEPPTITEPPVPTEAASET